jgi:hypothetical protein
MLKATFPVKYYVEHIIPPCFHAEYCGPRSRKSAKNRGGRMVDELKVELPNSGTIRRRLMIGGAATLGGMAMKSGFPLAKYLA